MKSTSIVLPLVARDYPKAILTSSSNDDDSSDDKQIIAELRREVALLKERLSFYTQTEELSEDLQGGDVLETPDEDDKLAQRRELIQAEIDNLSMDNLFLIYGKESTWHSLTSFDAKLYATALVQRCSQEKVAPNSLWNLFI